MSNPADYVTLTITRSNVGIARAGFGTPMILSANASFSERLRYYTDESDMVDDGFATDSPEYLAATAMFSQNPKPTRVAVGRCALPPTQVYTLRVIAAAAGTEYSVNVMGEGVTADTVTYTPGADLTVSAVTNGADSLTVVAHGMATGDGPYRVSNSGGGLPSGLAVDTNYWVIKLTADTFSLATSKANALALTAINLTTDGTGTQTIRRAQNDVICAQLVQGLNAIVGKNYAAVQTVGAGETDYITVTASAAGNWFDLEVTDLDALGVAQTHIDPGVATDLTAIAKAAPDWYGLCTLYNSKAYVAAAAAWVESNSRIYVVSVSDSFSATQTVTTGGTDTMDALATSAYTRTMCGYHPSNGAFFDAAWLGRTLPIDPGSESWKFKFLAGVAPVVLTATQRANIVAKSGNSYERIFGLNVTFEGTTSDGGYMDTTRGDDWVRDDMTKAVFAVLAAPDKVAFEDEGVAAVEAAVRASLDRAVRRKIYAANPKPAVSVPLVADLDASYKASRTLPDINWTATRSGAIHHANVRGSVAV